MRWRAAIGAAGAAAMVLAVGLAGADAKPEGKGGKPTAAEEAAVASGVLSKSEAQQNCKRMAGRMQIRLLELRGGGVSRGSSAVSQGVHSAAEPLFGGTKRGADAAADASRDLAKLKAMNGILKARNCPFYDLDTELAKPVSGPTPQLIRGKGKDKSKGRP